MTDWLTRLGPTDLAAGPGPPSLGPAAITDEPCLCAQCGRTIGWKATRPWRLLCRHCKADTVVD